MGLDLDYEEVQGQEKRMAVDKMEVVNWSPRIHLRQE